MGRLMAENDMTSLNLINDQDLTDFTPQSVVINGEKRDCDNWKTFFVEAVGLLVGSHPNTFQSGMMGQDNKRYFILLGNDTFRRRMFAPVGVPRSNLFVETNFTPEEMIAQLRYMLKYCDIPDSDVVVYGTGITGIKRNQPSETAAPTKAATPKEARPVAPKKDSPSPGEDAYRRYLAAEYGLAVGTVKSYVATIHTIERFAVEHEYDPYALLAGSKEDIQSVLAHLEKDTAFAEFNKKNYNRFDSAIKRFSAFLNSTYFTETPGQDAKPLRKDALPSHNTSENDTPEKRFVSFLEKSANLSSSTAITLVGSIHAVERYTKEHGYNPCALFEGTPSQIQMILMQLQEDSEFVALNNTIHFRYTPALNQLIAFVNSTYYSDADGTLSAGTKLRIDIPKFSTSKPLTETDMAKKSEKSKAVTQVEIAQPKKRFIHPAKAATPEPTEDTLTDDTRLVENAFRLFAKNEYGMTTATAYTQLLSLRTVQRFAKDHGYSPYSLFSGTADDIQGIINRLGKDNEFIEFCAQHSNRFDSPIGKLQRFIRSKYFLVAPRDEGKLTGPDPVEPLNDESKNAMSVLSEVVAEPAPDTVAQKEDQPSNEIEETTEVATNPGQVEEEILVDEPMEFAEASSESAVLNADNTPVESEHADTASSTDTTDEIAQSADVEQAETKQENPVEEAFVRFLRDTSSIKESMAREMVAELHDAEAFAKEHGYQPYLLFSGSAKDVRRVLNKLSSDKIFQSFFKKRGSTFKNAMKRFLRFVNSRYFVATPSIEKEKSVQSVVLNTPSESQMPMGEQASEAPQEETAKGAFIEAVPSDIADESPVLRSVFEPEHEDDRSADKIIIEFAPVEPEAEKIVNTISSLSDPEPEPIAPALTSESPEPAPVIPETAPAAAAIPAFADNLNVETVLAEKPYDDLREALLREGISTLEALRATNLWVFMNQHGLYSYQERLSVTTDVNTLLRSMDQSSRPREKWTLQYGGEKYPGVTPAEAYAALVESVVAKYPYKIRQMCGVTSPVTKKPMLYRKDLGMDCIKLSSVRAFIDRTLTSEDVVAYATWILYHCTGSRPEITVYSEKAEPVAKPQPVRVPTPSPVAEKPVETTVVPEKKAEIVPDEPEQPQNEDRTPPTELVSLIQKAEKYLLKADLDGMTADELQKKLDTNATTMKKAVFYSDHIVDMDGRYYHDEAFCDWDEGAEAIGAIIQKLLTKNGAAATFEQLYEYVRSEMDMFLNDNSIENAQQVYDLAKHLFEKVGYNGIHYEFRNNKYISLPGKSVETYLDIIAHYAREKGDTITYSEIEEYSERAGLSTGNIRGKLRIGTEPIFLVYGENEYLLAESMGINEDFLSRTRTALEKLFADVGDHIVLRNIDASWYHLLPALPYSLHWTALLLQNVLAFWGKKLGARTLAARDGQSSNTLHAMLVSADSPIESFHDAVSAMLLENGLDRRSFDTDELRGLIVDWGMVAGNEIGGVLLSQVLAGDPRFVWSSDKSKVTVRLENG